MAGSITYLEGIGLSAIARGLNSRVERALLSIVGSAVHIVQELQVGRVDVLGVLEVERREDGEGLGLCITGGAARDGDVVEGGGLKDGAGLTLAGGQGGGEGREGEDGDGGVTHVERLVVIGF